MHVPGQPFAQLSMLLGAVMAEPFWSGFQGGMLLLFFFIIFIFLNDIHVAVIQSHVWCPFWEQRGHSSKIRSFTQPLLCLGDLFLYPAEVGKPGWQYLPKTPVGFLPPEPKPPAAWLQCNWSLSASRQNRTSRGSSVRTRAASPDASFSPILEVGPSPFPLNLACRSLANLPLSPKLSKKAPQDNKQPQTNSNTLFWKEQK